jgi:hypothetical protein
MKVALCVIGRLENQYAAEFVEWYKNLGFDKVFIYDNNHDSDEHFEEVLQPQVDCGFVEIVPFRNREVAQISAYNDCYSKHNKEFDWIAFFDFDEFLVLEKDNNIKDFLSKIGDYQCVKINWMTFTDNNLILNDGRPLNERFTEPADFDVKKGYSFPENNHVKSIIRCGIDKFNWSGNPHVCGMGIKCCDANGKESSNSPFQPYDFETAYLKHFSMKTIDEYINNKLKRGVGDRSYSSFKGSYKIDDFFKINEKTVEKEDYIKKWNEQH